MAVASSVLSSNLRLTDQEDDHITSYRNIKTNITGQEVTVFMDAFGLLRDEPVGNAFLVITNELTQED